MLENDDDDDYVGVFGIGAGVELPTGGDTSVSDRGLVTFGGGTTFCSDAGAYVVVIYVVVVVRPVSSGCVRIVLLSFAHEGVCW